MDLRAGGILKDAVTKRAPGRLVMLRLWFELHPVVGLVWGALLIAAFAGSLLWLLAPVRPSSIVYGVVTSLGMSERDEGSFPTAMVRVEGWDARVPLARYQLCGRDDQIKLVKRPNRMGASYRAAPNACGR
jgi:hypothetical protein